MKSSNGWHNINYNGNSGAWISGNYVQTNTSSSPVKSTPDPSSKYSSASSSAIIGPEATLQEIQASLNTKFASAPEVVKTRSSRLASIISNSNKQLSALYGGNYMNNPVNITSGTTS